MILKLLFLLLVILSQLNVHYLTIIRKIVEGDLSTRWKFSFRISVDNFIGVILYSVDSERNKFVVHVRTTTNRSKVVHVHLNKLYKDISLKQLCGCDPCDVTLMKFYVSMLSEEINVKCNFYGFISFENTVLHNGLSNYTGYMAYPVPQSIVKTNNKLEIIMGNIGPMVAEGGIYFKPLPEQMVGCLNYLRFNKALVDFDGSGDKFRSSCPDECTPIICNRGTCSEDRDESLCDCSFTAMNGLYCDRALRPYVAGNNNSYELSENSTELYLKMTWKQIINNNYCLIEIVGRHGFVTIQSHRNHLMLDTFDLTILSVTEPNFVSVNITDNIMFVRTSDAIKYIPGDFHRVNVGFSERDNVCETFHGSHDVYYDSFRVRRTASLEMHKKSPILFIARTRLNSNNFLPKSRYQDYTQESIRHSKSKNAISVRFLVVMATSGILLISLVVVIVIVSIKYATFNVRVNRPPINDNLLSLNVIAKHDQINSSSVPHWDEQHAIVGSRDIYIHPEVHDATRAAEATLPLPPRNNE